MHNFDVRFEALGYRVLSQRASDALAMKREEMFYATPEALRSIYMYVTAAGWQVSFQNAAVRDLVANRGD